jgi:hypothetical protein
MQKGYSKAIVLDAIFERLAEKASRKSSVQDL